ncbi:MAG: Xaa-Pro peptidase family protein [Caldilineaceae bacterium]
MHNEQRQRARTLLQEKGIECALFASRESVGWLTGFVAPVNTGPNFFAGAPPLVWYEAGKFTLIVLDGWGAAAADFGKEADGEVVTYPTYTIQAPIQGTKNLQAALKPIFKSGRNATAIGVELTHVNAVSFIALKEAAQNGNFPSIDGWLKPLRKVKTAEELTKLRENFHLSDVGHLAARKAVRPGRTELEVWEDIHAAMTVAAGQRIAIGNDCVVCTRENNIGGWPGDLMIRENDSVIVDLSAVKYGYWSDSCATYYAGTPSQKMREMHAMALEAQALGKSLLKPGAVAKEIDKTLRDFVAKAGYPVYPHHTGHQVGLSGHEDPRIVPYCEEVLEPGMVIMLEPGTYFPRETGVRLEHAYLITETGCEQITTHEIGIL